MSLHWPKFHFLSEKIGKSQFPFYPFVPSIRCYVTRGRTSPQTETCLYWSYTREQETKGKWMFNYDLISFLAFSISRSTMWKIANMVKTIVGTCKTVFPYWSAPIFSWNALVFMLQGEISFRITVRTASQWVFWCYYLTVDSNESTFCRRMLFSELQASILNRKEGILKKVMA